MLIRLLLALALPGLALAQDNVLLVLMDDVGVDSIATYGEGVDPADTPVMDALAQNGVLFRNCWSNPACTPTRATIQTGRYAFRTGLGFLVAEKGLDLQLDEFILPEALAAGTPGHASGGFGKWHLTNREPPDSQYHANVSGYDHWAGTWNNILQPFDYSYWIRTENGLSQVTTRYPTTDTVDSFLAWHSKVTGPWFGYIAFHAAHEPYHVPPPGLHTVNLPNVDPREEPVPFYRAMVQAMDTELGRLLAGLGGDLANTHVIVVGDNGTPKAVSLPPFEPSHAKLTPFEGGINVPLIIGGPAVVQPGRESDALVNCTDLFLTTIEMAGYTPGQVLPPQLVHDSISVVPYLADPAQPALRDWVFSELWKPNGFGPKKNDQRTLRDDRYKILGKGTNPANYAWFMFDLEMDPFETRDLFDQGGGLTPEQQTRFDYLKSELEQLLATG